MFPWSVGFWPSEKPRYAFVIMIEKGPSDAKYGATSVMRLLLDWMNVYARQYFVDHVAPKVEDVQVDTDNGDATGNSSTTNNGRAADGSNSGGLNTSTSTINSLLEIERPN
jgi:hypothetical protein